MSQYGKMLDPSLRLNVVGPPGIPTINNLRFLANPAFYILDRLAPLSMGPVIPVTNGNGSLLLVRGQEATKQFFTDNKTFYRANDGTLKLPDGYPWSRMFDTVITANGQDHRRRRKLLAPVFHTSVMDHYQSIFIETFKQSKFAMRNEDTFDMVKEFRLIARTNMLICLMGLEPNARNLELARRVADLLNTMLDPTVLMFRRNHWSTPYGRWIRQVADTYRRLSVLIEGRRAEKPRQDALSILCHTTDEEGVPLTTPEIAGELHGLFAAGYETTASAMIWAMLAWLRQPDTALESLDALVNETQRLIPSVPVSLPRRVMRDVQIAGSSTVPRGAVVIVSPLLEHRNPDVFPDPHTFRPSRWHGLRPSPYAFLPFGIGQRRCPGAGFADLQVGTTLRLALESTGWHSLTSHINYRIKSGIIAFPDKQIPIKRGSRGPLRQLTGSVTKLWKESD